MCTCTRVERQKQILVQSLFCKPCPFTAKPRLPLALWRLLCDHAMGRESLQQMMVARTARPLENNKPQLLLCAIHRDCFEVDHSHRIKDNGHNVKNKLKESASKESRVPVRSWGGWILLKWLSESTKGKIITNHMLPKFKYFLPNTLCKNE